MKINIKIVLATTTILAPKNTLEIIPDDINELSDLPLNELLSQKKFLTYDNSSLNFEETPTALPLIGGGPGKIDPLEHMQIKGLHRLPIKRGHYEEEEDEGWEPKGKDKGKINKIFNTSIMALSFLAFGGYLLCLIVNAIKEKNMEMMATPAPASQQFLLQQLMNNKPYPPYPLRLPTGTIPAFTISGKRKKRSNTNPFRFYESNAIKMENGTEVVDKLLDSLQFFSEDIVAVYNLQQKI